MFGKELNHVIKLYPYLAFNIYSKYVLFGVAFNLLVAFSNDDQNIHKLFWVRTMDKYII
jgi:hypothetical protein|uniref:Uncharacterized protein n=1 Tax=Mus musculus TaxID=10090 RepID=Q3UQI1_MOUSE|nr:unnamed protein product [Mus musculus]